MRSWKFKRSFFFVLVLLLFGIGLVRAQAACPWLTQGTAAAYLGGDATIVVQTTDPNQGVCRFTHRQHSSFAMLEIAVNYKTSKTCPPSSPSVVGLGSHAVACHSMHHGRTADAITGNVRETRFTVRLVTRRWTSGPASEAGRSSIVEQTAEEVVGNLF